MVLHEILQESKVKYSIVCDFYLCECKRDLASSWEWTWLLWRAVMKGGYSWQVAMLKAFGWMHFSVWTYNSVHADPTWPIAIGSWAGAYFVLRKYWAMGSLTSLFDCMRVRGLWFRKILPSGYKDFISPLFNSMVAPIFIVWVLEREQEKIIYVSDSQPAVHGLCWLTTLLVLDRMTNSSIWDFPINSFIPDNLHHSPKLTSWTLVLNEIKEESFSWSWKYLI